MEGKSSRLAKGRVERQGARSHHAYLTLKFRLFVYDIYSKPPTVFQPPDGPFFTTAVEVAAIFQAGGKTAGSAGVAAIPWPAPVPQMRLQTHIESSVVGMTLVARHTIHRMSTARRLKRESRPARAAVAAAAVPRSGRSRG